MIKATTKKTTTKKTTTKATTAKKPRAAAKKPYQLTEEQKAKYIAEFNQKMQARTLHAETIGHNRKTESPVKLDTLSKPTIGSKFSFLADLSISLRKAGK